MGVVDAVVKVIVSPLVSALLLGSGLVNGFTLLFTVLSVEFKVPQPNFITRSVVGISLMLVFSAIYIRATYGLHYSIVRDKNSLKAGSTKSLWFKAIFQK